MASVKLPILPARTPLLSSALVLTLTLAAVAALAGPSSPALAAPGPPPPPEAAGAKAAPPLPPLAPAIAPGGALPTLSLQEVRAGQRGYGLSVFTGGEPE